MGTFGQFITIVLLATLVGVGLLCATLFRLRYAVLAIGVMFFLASISTILDYYKHVYPTWLLPLQSRRAELFGLTGILLFAGAMMHYRELSLRRIPVQGWLLLLMGVYAGVLRMYHVSLEDGGQTVALVLATLAPLLLVNGAILRDRNDCERLFKAIVWAWFVWTLGAGVQYVLDPRLVVLGASPHFTGLIGTPNQAATIIAVVAVLSLWLALNGRGVLKPVYIGLTGLYVIELVWTGSRGGMGMFVIGLTSVLYGRMGRMVLLLPLFALATYGAVALTEAMGIEVWTGKLLTGTNTRAKVWSAMISTAISNPVFGVGTVEAGGSENSYLVSFSSYGIVMFLLILALLVAGIAHTARLFQLRRWLGRDDRTLVDLCIGQQMAFFAGGVFEGFIVGRVGSNMLLYLMVCAIGAMLLETARGSQESSGAHGWSDQGYEPEADDGDHPPLPA